MLVLLVVEIQRFQELMDVIGRHGSLKYAIEKAPFKFGRLFGVFGLAREVAMEDADGQCSAFSREVRRYDATVVGIRRCLESTDVI